eukprot:366433-Chlamydomonas_euryale.AAC.22
MPPDRESPPFDRRSPLGADGGCSRGSSSASRAGSNAGGGFGAAAAAAALAAAAVAHGGGGASSRTSGSSKTDEAHLLAPLLTEAQAGVWQVCTLGLTQCREGSTLAGQGGAAYLHGREGSTLAG